MPPIRTSYRNIGGPFPGKGSAPAMTKDFHLVDGKASFERFNDEAAMRSHSFDAGSLVAANDNQPPAKKAKGLQMKFKSFQEAMTAERPIQAANDNTPRKAPQPRYRGTLPALRWLYDNHPDLAAAVAAALPKPHTNWSAEVADNSQKIRPTVEALMRAAADAFRVYVRNGKKHVGAGLVLKQDGGLERATLGTLKFLNGRLTEWAHTKKGAKLRPIDQLQPADAGVSSHRDPSRYLRTRPTTLSPMHTTSLPRNVSDRPVLPPMYDPQAGVEAARALLCSLGVDGSVPFDRLPVGSTRCEAAVAQGAGFLGGVSRPSGNSSSGGELWEAPENRQGDVVKVVEEVAARGSLKSIGIRLGYSEDYADRAGKAALLDAAKTLAAANDNKKMRKCA